MFEGSGKSKPVKMMNCEHCGDEIVRKMCTQRYCYKCNGEVNRIQRRTAPRKKKAILSNNNNLKLRMIL